ncbi:hypothetical protein GCM10008994_29760 [Halorubrum ejinorense]|uniref:Uncharacterized protein n=1 Tax=Halorubrum ejinorense TaxID=425309 RepID=A0AAV3SWT3_9EURY
MAALPELRDAVRLVRVRVLTGRRALSVSEADLVRVTGGAEASYFARALQKRLATAETLALPVPVEAAPAASASPAAFISPAAVTSPVTSTPLTGRTTAR